MNQAVGRKVRSDKLKEFKPTIPISLKDSIYRLSTITNIPRQDVAEDMIKYAIYDYKILSSLSLHFKRDLALHNKFYVGRLTNESIKKRETGPCERMTTRLRGEDAEIVSALAYALDVTPTRVSALLLDATMKDRYFINDYVEQYLASNITKGQLQELKKLLQFINRHNPSSHSFAALLSELIDGVGIPAIRIKEAVKEFLSNL